MMKVLVLAATILGLGYGAASASPIFFENFDGVTSQAAMGYISERGLGYLLDFHLSIPGWTMQGDPSQIFGFDLDLFGGPTIEMSGDRAVWLNEGSAGSNPAQGISRTITGLLPGIQHTLSFEYWGDDVSDPYSFSFEIDGITTAVSATHSGQNTGVFHTQSFTFTPLSSATTLSFAETSQTASSPIIDNISISVADVPEPSTTALLCSGLLALVMLTRRRESRRSGRVTASRLGWGALSLAVGLVAAPANATPLDIIGAWNFLSSSTGSSFGTPSGDFLSFGANCVTVSGRPRFTLLDHSRTTIPSRRISTSEAMHHSIG